MDIPGIRYRVVKHLPAYLLKYGSVDLMGIGRFRLVGHSSTIDYASSLVYPPYYDVTYEPNADDGAKDYVQYLSKRLGLDDSLVNEVMRDYTAALKVQLDNFEPVTLEGLGILIKSREFDTNFESDEAYWGRSAVAELAVSFTPVLRLKNTSEEEKRRDEANESVMKDVATVSSIGDDIIASEKSSEVVEPDELNLETDWEEDIVEAEVETTAESEVPVSMNELFAQQNDSTQKKESNPVMLPPKEVHQSAAQDNTVISSEHVMKSDIPQARERNKGNRLALPILIGLLMLALPVSWYLFTNQGHEKSDQTTEVSVPPERLNQDPSSTKDSSSPAIDEVADPTEADLKTQAETDEKNNQNEIEGKKKQRESTAHNNQKTSEKNTVVSSETGECIIVVGAFAQGPNRYKMVNRLESKGYRVYVDSARRLARVGIYAPCNKTSLANELSRLQTEVESSSWVLKDR